MPCYLTELFYSLDYFYHQSSRVKKKNFLNEQWNDKEMKQSIEVKKKLHEHLKGRKAIFHPEGIAMP
jgi:hypothetical protein